MPFLALHNKCVYVLAEKMKYDKKSITIVTQQKDLGASYHQPTIGTVNNSHSSCHSILHTTHGKQDNNEINAF